MTKLSLYVLLWVTYFVSVALMVVDLFYSDFLTNLIFFYLLTNGVLIYRLFGVYWFTILIHAFIHVGVLITFIVLNLDEILTFFNMALCVPLALQCLIALHLVVFRRGRSPDEQACHSGIHAHIGLIVIIIFFWNVDFVRIRWAYCGLFSIFYMLLFLGIVLTPHFHGLSKAFLKLGTSGGKRRRSKRSPRSRTSSESMRKVKFGAVAPGHRQKR